MFHKAIDIEYKEGTTLQVSFQDGAVKEYDVSALFVKYPQMRQLEDRELFLSGRLSGFYGIIWNDELDIETETIYESGRTVRQGPEAPGIKVGDVVLAARAKAEMTQKELSAITGIDQSDISKIERGVANPTVATLERIAHAMGGNLKVTIEL